MLLRLILLRLIHGNTLRARLFFGLGLLGAQGLVDPVVGSFQIFLTGGKVVAFYVGLFAVHQVEIGHGVVVVGTELDCLIEAVDAFRDQGSVLDLQVGANFFLVFVLGVEVLVGLHAKFGALFHTRLVAGSPIDDAH